MLNATRVSDAVSTGATSAGEATSADGVSAPISALDCRSRTSGVDRMMLALNQHRFCLGGGHLALWALSLCLLLYSPTAAADFRTDYAEGVRSFEIGSDWSEVRSRMERAISQTPPPISGSVNARDRRAGGLDYIPHAYLAIAILRSSRDCASARRALDDPGHKKALLALRPSGESIARQAEQEVAQACPAAPAVPDELIRRAEEMLRRIREAISSLEQSAALVPEDSRANATSLRSELLRSQQQLDQAIKDKNESVITAALGAGEPSLVQASAEVSRLELIAKELVAAKDKEVTTPTPAVAASDPEPATLPPALLTRISGLINSSNDELGAARSLSQNSALRSQDEGRALVDVIDRIGGLSRQLLAARDAVDAVAAERKAGELEKLLGELRQARLGAEQMLARSADRAPPELVAAITLYLAGQFDQVTDVRIDGSLSARAQAHFKLLQSASFFHLAKAARSEQQLGKARDLAKQAKAQDASLKPSDRVFSPEFLALFRSA